MATLRDNVRLVDPQTTLTTDGIGYSTGYTQIAPAMLRLART
jgi:hypothetical protein